MSLDEVAKAGEDLWNELGQTEANDDFDPLFSAVEGLFAQVESEDELDAALSAIEGLFAQMEQKAPHE